MYATLPTFAYVLDASVGIKLFAEEDDSDKVDALFQRFADEPDARLHVPTLFFTECTNILWKLARRGDRTAEDVQADVGDLISLALPHHAELKVSEFEFGHP